MLLQRALLAPSLSGGAPLSAAMLLLHAPRHRAGTLSRLAGGHDLRAALSGLAGRPTLVQLRAAATTMPAALSPPLARLLSSAPAGSGGGGVPSQSVPPPGTAKPATPGGGSGSSQHSDSGGGDHDGGDHGHGGAGAHPEEVSFFSSPIGWWRANNAKVKRMMAAYGYVTVATYLGVYVITLGSLFGLVSAGAVKGPDVNAFVNGWFVKKALLGDREVHIPPAWGDFATAWVLTKTTEPFRLVATIAAVPAVVRRAPTGLLRALRVPEKVLAKRAREAAEAAVSKKAAALVVAALGLPPAAGPSGRDASPAPAATVSDRR